MSNGNGPEFFRTQMGHRFYESTMPRLVAALEKLVVLLEKSSAQRRAVECACVGADQGKHDTDDCPGIA